MRVKSVLGAVIAAELTVTLGQLSVTGIHGVAANFIVAAVVVGIVAAWATSAARSGAPEARRPAARATHRVRAHPRPGATADSCLIPRCRRSSSSGRGVRGPPWRAPSSRVTATSRSPVRRGSSLACCACSRCGGAPAGSFPGLRAALLANGRLARSGLEPDQLRSSLANTEPTSPSDAIGAVYRTYGDRSSARIVGDKTPGYVDHLRLLADRFPTATFIQMVRHPLDVVSSMTDQPWAPDDPAACALIWKQSQRRAARSGVGPDRRLVVRLEDLVGDADATVARICAHLGVQVEPAMFDFQARAVDISAQNIHPQSHAGLGRSLGRTRDWRETLAPDDAAAAWSIVRREAEALGYSGPAPAAVSEARVRARLFAFNARRSVRSVRTLVRTIRP